MVIRLRIELGLKQEPGYLLCLTGQRSDPAFNVKWV